MVLSDRISQGIKQGLGVSMNNKAYSVLKIIYAIILFLIGIYGFYYLTNLPPVMKFDSTGMPIGIGIISGCALLGSALVIFRLKS